MKSESSLSLVAMASHASQHSFSAQGTTGPEEEDYPVPGPLDMPPQAWRDHLHSMRPPEMTVSLAWDDCARRAVLESTAWAERFDVLALGFASKLVRFMPANAGEADNAHHGWLPQLTRTLQYYWSHTSRRDFLERLTRMTLSSLDSPSVGEPGPHLVRQRLLALAEEFGDDGAAIHEVLSDAGAATESTGQPASDQDALHDRNAPAHFAPPSPLRFFPGLSPSPSAPSDFASPSPPLPAVQPRAGTAAASPEPPRLSRQGAAGITDSSMKPEPDSSIASRPSLQPEPPRRMSEPDLLRATPKRIGHYLPLSARDYLAIDSSPAFVKKNAGLFNLLHWNTFLRSVARGHFGKSVGIQALRQEERTGTGFVIDGFDDMANALQGSGLPQQAVAAGQLALYMALLPLLDIGRKAAASEHRAVKAGYQQCVEELPQLKAGLIRLLHAAGEPTLTEAMVATKPEAFPDFLLQHRSTLVLRPELLHEAVTLAEQVDALGMLEARITSTMAAMHGTRLMEAGVVLYAAGVGPSFVTGGAATALATGTATSVIIGSAAAGCMGVAQLLMAFYGAAEAKVACGQSGRLSRTMSELDRSPIFAAPEFTHLKTDLLSRVQQQQKLLRLGRIGGNAALSAGQLAMIGGTVATFAGGAGMPILMAGAGLTLAAIALKLYAQKKQEKFFPMDAESIDLRHLLQEATPHQAIAALEKERREIVHQMVRAELVQHVFDPSLPGRSPGPGWRLFDALFGRYGVSRYPKDVAVNTLQRHYSKPGLEAQQRALDEMRSDKRMMRLLDRVSMSDTAGVPAMAALLPITEKGNPDFAATFKARLDSFKDKNPSLKLQEVLDMAKAAGLENEVHRKLVKRLIFKERGRNNRRGAAYAPYIMTKFVEKQRTWRLPAWLPLIGGNTFTRSRIRTVYQFDMNKLCLDLGNPSCPARLHELESKVYDAVLASVKGNGVRRLWAQQHAVETSLLRLSTLRTEADLHDETRMERSLVHLFKHPARVYEAILAGAPSRPVTKPYVWPQPAARGRRARHEAERIDAVSEALELITLAEERFRDLGVLGAALPAPPRIAAYRNALASLWRHHAHDPELARRLMRKLDAADPLLDALAEDAVERLHIPAHLQTEAMVAAKQWFMRHSMYDALRQSFATLSRDDGPYGGLTERIAAGTATYPEYVQQQVLQSVFMDANEALVKAYGRSPNPDLRPAAANRASFAWFADHPAPDDPLQYHRL
jgi:hypothetical protein